MALLVNCECGERVVADDSQAGEQVPCPACGKPVEMPQAYNPLSTVKYVQAAAEAPPVEEPKREGMTCPNCAGSGHCAGCQGTGQRQEPFLERLTSGITGVVTGFFTAIGDALGAGPTGGRRVQTRSEQRRANACQACDGKGKCFKCEGSGYATD